jgi:very-short-patch-repair endonuclease
MARLFREHGLPEPVFQYAVTVDGRRIVIDFAYPHLKIAIEVDGYEWHRTREQLQADHERQALLVLLGWKVLRFTWQQVRERPEWVAGRILRLLGTST